MYSFDASAIIDLWDNYPIQNPHFKPVWDWFNAKVEQKVFVISNIAFQETKDQNLLNQKQIQTLTKLRNTLLPKLISGKIRV